MEEKQNRIFEIVSSEWRGQLKRLRKKSTFDMGELKKKAQMMKDYDDMKEMENRMGLSTKGIEEIGENGELIQKQKNARW